MECAASWPELYPPGVALVTAALAPDAEAAPLYPEECATLGRAGARRRAEFAAGRACARAALAALGLPAAALPRGPDRGPRWPRGVVGSVSHCAGLVAAAAARVERFAGVGLDVERRGRLQPRLYGRVFAAAERPALAALEATAPDLDWATVFFCAKEAAWKCLASRGERAPSLRRLLVSIAPEGRALRVDPLRGGAPLAGRFAAVESWVGVGLVAEP